MSRLMVLMAATVALAIAGCSDESPVEPPKPFALTTDAIGRYCGMDVLEHPGPKGQIILGQIPEPIWFSSARDAVAFTMLPEEPKNIAAIYVSDMAKAESWEKPGAENWVEARQAFYVIGSAMRGGMGAPEAVPFSTQVAADAFARDNGGEVVGFTEIPSHYVLGAGEDDTDAQGGAPATTGATH